MVAHTGLDHLLTVGDLWRELPMDKQIIMRWWQVPRAEIPAGREARIDWLYAWWERIDDLGGAEPAGGSLLRPAPVTAACCGGARGRQARCSPSGASSIETTSAGLSGVVTACGVSAWSASASSGEEPPRRRRRRPAPGSPAVDRAWPAVGGVAEVGAVGAGDGTYDDCQLSLLLPPWSLLATKPSDGGEAADEQELLELAALLRLGLAR